MILPFQSVVSQLNTLMADGTAINKVNNVNIDPKNGFMPDTNMWCAHTIIDKEEIAKKEPTIAIYPKIGLRELVEITSEVIPIAGNATIYTSG